MYFIPYLFNHVYIFIGCIDFSSWLGLACIVVFLILTVHSYVAPTLNKFLHLFIIYSSENYSISANIPSINQEREYPTTTLPVNTHFSYPPIMLDKK